MKSTIYSLFLFSFLLLFYSCDENSFSQVVTIDIPPHESALSVRALFQQDDANLEVFVANSLGILDKDEFEVQESALVNLFEDNQLMYTFSFQTGSLDFYAPFPGGFGKTGATYRLEISAPDYPPVQATQTLPASIPILSGKYTPEGTISSDGERVDAIEIEFEDPIGKGNYYGFRAAAELSYFDGQDTIRYYNDLYLESNDPLLTYGNNGILIMQDQAFDGKKYKLLMYSYNALETESINVQLLSLSKDTYLYYRSLSDYWDAQDNPFAEPVNVHSNIENGHGIFGLAGISELKIR